MKEDKEIQNVFEVLPNALRYGKHYLLPSVNNETALITGVEGRKIPIESFFSKEDDGKMKTVKITCFRTNNKYARLLNYRLAPLHKLALLLPSLARPELSPLLVPVMLTVDTYYPGSSSTDNPVDGVVYRAGVSELFSNVRAGNGTGVGETWNPLMIGLYSVNGSSGYFKELDRGEVCFNSASIGTDNVTSSVLSLYISGANNGLGNPTMHICQANPAATDSLSAGDYQAMKNYTTSFGYFSWLSPDTYNDITLNASGVSNISKSGISKFGLRLSWDMNNSFTGTWANNTYSGFQFYTSNQSGTTSDPKLTVTHSASFSPQLMMCS
jgi:hypothetical protein